MKPIPISAARDIAERFGYDQVVIIARKVGAGADAHGEHVTTYGRDPAHCAVAARMGDFLKFKVTGWTLEQSPSVPEGFALVPKSPTRLQLDEMIVAASAMLKAVGKIDCELLYGCGVQAFASEIDRASIGVAKPDSNEDLRS